MKPLAIATLVCALVGLTFAQSDIPITEWTDLSSPDDEFSIQAPRGFEFEKASLPHNAINARGELHTQGDRFYLFIDALKDPHQRKQVEAFVRYAHPVESETSGSDVRKVEFEDPSGYYHRIIFVETSNRIFTLQTVSQGKNSENAIRFLNSFRLLPPSAPDATPAQESRVVDPNSDALFSIETSKAEPAQPVSRGGGMGSSKGQGSGSGIGTGSGSGNGSGSGTAASPSVSPKVTSPLRITVKAKASYTDFARFYMIQGTVTLRVTFLASGEIGSVTAIRKLPFGLTETAMYAAKSMRFEPEMVNGVARTTTRPVSYVFNIY